MTLRQIELRRVYRPRSSHDGVRVAPSPALRRWYGHDPRRWGRFRNRYRREIAQRTQALHALQELRRRGPVTLLFAASDEAHSHAVVLREVLAEGVVQ